MGTRSGKSGLSTQPDRRTAAVAGRTSRGLKTDHTLDKFTFGISGLSTQPARRTAPVVGQTSRGLRLTILFSDPKTNQHTS